MQIDISSDAEDDLTRGHWFYEQQTFGVGNYFRTSVIADIESLVIHAGVRSMQCSFEPVEVGPESVKRQIGNG